MHILQLSDIIYITINLYLIMRENIIIMEGQV